MYCTFALLLLLPTDPWIPWGDLSDQGEGAGLRVGKVQALHLHHHLPHHVVPAVPVKGQHHKVQRKDRQLVEVNSIECEILIINWIQGATNNSSLNLMLFLRQQLQLHIGVAQFVDSVTSRKISAVLDCHYQRCLLKTVSCSEEYARFFLSIIFLNFGTAFVHGLLMFNTSPS